MKWNVSTIRKNSDKKTYEMQCMVRPKYTHAKIRICCKVCCNKEKDTVQSIIHQNQDMPKNKPKLGHTLKPKYTTPKTRIRPKYTMPKLEYTKRILNLN